MLDAMPLLSHVRNVFVLLTKVHNLVFHGYQNVILLPKEHNTYR